MDIATVATIAPVVLIGAIVAVRTQGFEPKTFKITAPQENKKIKKKKPQQKQQIIKKLLIFGFIWLFLNTNIINLIFFFL